MGTFSRLVPEHKPTLVRRLLGGAACTRLGGGAVLLYVNCWKNNTSQDIGLDPIMLGILSQFLLETEGSCESEGPFEWKRSLLDNYM